MFKVLIQTSSNNIEWVNVFELPVWNRIEKALKDAYDEVKPSSKDALRSALEPILTQELMYYFWSKCEWEVVVQGWPNDGTERKIDVYEQIMANYESFKRIVFDNI